MKEKSILKGGAELALFAAFALVLCMPKSVSKASYDALCFCAKSVIPPLFVSTVLAKAAAKSFIFKKLPLTAEIFIIATLCGCPAGAIYVKELYSGGEIDEKAAGYLLSFSAGASLPFLVGYVGAGLFGDIFAGLKLAAFQLTAKALIAVIFKKIIFKKEKIPKAAGKSRRGLSEEIRSGAEAMITVCASVVFFVAVANAFSDIVGAKGFLRDFIGSAAEFSSGCKALCRYEHGFLLTAFTVGHGGLSAAAQIIGTAGGEIDLKYFFVGKAAECFIITALSFLFG